MRNAGVGFTAYAGRSGGVFVPEAPNGAGAGRPELADVGRLVRRAAQGMVRAARHDDGSALSTMLREHLGAVVDELAVVEESWRSYDHVNVQAGLDAWLAEDGQESRLVGLTGFQHQEFGLAELLAGPERGHRWGPQPGNVARVQVPAGPDGEVRACVVCAVYLVGDGSTRTALLFRGPERDGMSSGVTLQVVSTEPGAAAAAAAAVRRLAVVHNVFRGQVLSFGGEIFDSGQTLLQFHRRPALRREHLILPDSVLETVERQVLGLARHRQRLLASGQHLKRGVLLYGPPGTGKTHTVRYLMSRATATTVLQLTGSSVHLVGEACSVARTLQPAVVVIEDVDLIAEERGAYPGEHPMLFQLLNEMDGLAEDADVVFVLTTNRADLLEPALAARPGRVDAAVELTLPDVGARRALLALYRASLVLDEGKLDDLAARTDGVTASFLKELLRRAAVLAAEAGDDDSDGPIAVSDAQLDTALDELLDTHNAMTRVLLGSSGDGFAAPDWPDGD